MRRIVLLVLGLSTAAACGSRIEGTSAALPGSAIVIYRASDADEMASSIDRHNAPILAAIQLSMVPGPSRDSAFRMIRAAVDSPTFGLSRKIDALGTGTVGVDHRISINGRFRGEVAIVSTPTLGINLGCRVNERLELFGSHGVTLAGDRCLPWAYPIDPMPVLRDIAAKREQDSLSLAQKQVAESVTNARSAMMKNWPFVADRDGVYYFKTASRCAAAIAEGRRTYLRDSLYAHKLGYGRSTEPDC